MRQLLILIPVVWLAACASSGPEAAAVASSDQVTCTREASVGSRIVERKCRTAEQVEADRVNAERTKDAVRSSVPRANANVPGG
jgi:hypothetical protein